MERLCHALHPELDLSPTCLHWYQQATEHCTGLILQTKKPSGEFWTTVRNFIFPDRQTSLLNPNMPIIIHPKRLTLRDCQSLFLDMVNDYVVRAPRYSAESTTNALLWQVLYSLLGIMALGSLLVSTIFAYQKYGRKLKRLERPDIIFAPEQRARAYINRNMRIMKNELIRLRVKHLVQPEEMFGPDGTATLIMRMSTKLELLDTIITSQTQAMGRLYRLQELMGKKNPIVPDFKVETMQKALKFLEKYPQKLRVLFVFDEVPMYEQQARKRKSSSPPKGNPLKFDGSPMTLASMPSSLSKTTTVLRSFNTLTTSRRSSPLRSSPRMCSPRTSSPRTSPPRLSSPRSISPLKVATGLPPLRTSLQSPRLKTQIPRSFNRNSTSVTICHVREK